MVESSTASPNVLGYLLQCTIEKYRYTPLEQDANPTTTDSANSEPAVLAENWTG